MEQMFLARWRDVAVGVVAVRFHADGTGELKRMHVPAPDVYRDRQRA
jgi:hypothetical protein